MEPVPTIDWVGRKRARVVHDWSAEHFAAGVEAGFFRQPELASPPVNSPMIAVSVKTDIPFLRALVLEPCGRNCSPAPDLVFFKLIVQRGFSFGGIFVSQTPVVQDLWRH